MTVEFGGIMKSPIVLLILFVVTIGLTGTGCKSDSSSSEVTISPVGESLGPNGQTPPAGGTTEAAPPGALPLDSPTPGSPTPSSSPQASSAPVIRQITAGGAHACALSSDNSIWCWGNNKYKQLGNLTDPNKLTRTSTPVLVDITRKGEKAGKVISIQAGGSFTCAIVDPLLNGVAKAYNQSVVCWGDAQNDLALGSGGSIQPNDYVRFYNSNFKSNTILTGVTQISLGTGHACAVAAGGNAYCWGFGTNAQLGQGTLDNSNVAKKVVNLGPVTTLTTNGLTTCAKLHNPQNGLFNTSCWGSNSIGQIPTLTPSAAISTPNPLLSFMHATDYELLLKHDSLCRLENRTLTCMQGQIGKVALSGSNR